MQKAFVFVTSFDEDKSLKPNFIEYICDNNSDYSAIGKLGTILLNPRKSVIFPNIILHLRHLV